MSKKELDVLVEQYFKPENWASPTLNLEMLVEMIEDVYPDISAADPAGIGVDGVNPELVADKVAALGDVSREGVINTLTQMLGSADPGMVDRVMMQISNPQGLSAKGAPQAQINESWSAEQWAKMYRELLLMGVPADTMEAIRILKDSGLTAEELKAMLSQQTMTDLKGVQTAPVTGVGDRWSLEESETRFSYEFNLPKLIPTEAWGNPDSMDRKQIERVFGTIRGGSSMKARIDDLNSFLSPVQFKSGKRGTRRRSPAVIINMMMITEALQATLNDYNESAAGFVFEAFMSALTGGEQIVGRVKGTLPIEDFVAFSQFGGSPDRPVSLKLLSPDTTIKGSFTNLVDYLFVRGADSISYLIAFKKVIGGKVEGLQIFDFNITRENLIDVMIASKNDKKVIGPNYQNIQAQWPTLLKNWGGPGGSLTDIASVIVPMPGYNGAKGFLSTLDGEGQAQVPAEQTPSTLDDNDDGVPDWMEPLLTDEEKAIWTSKRTGRKQRAELLQLAVKRKERADWQAKTSNRKAFGEVTPTDPAEIEAYEKRRCAKSGGEWVNGRCVLPKELPLAESFHEAEKRIMAEERLAEELMTEAEKTDKKSQWGISRAQMDAMSSLPDFNLQDYGQVDLSEENIQELVKIYGDVLGESIKLLLNATKELTDNIGRYYSEEKRDRAMAAGEKGKDKAEEVAGILADEVAAKKKAKEDPPQI